MAKVGKKKISGIIGRHADRDAQGGKRPVLPEDITIDIVYDAIHDMIFTKDVNGRITSVNDIYAKRNLTTKEELIGKTIFDMGIMPEDRARAVTQMDEQVMKSREMKLIRDWIVLPDGTKMYAELTTAPLIKDGESTGVLVMFKDLTELRLMMDEIEKQNMILETISEVSQLMLEPDIHTFEQTIQKAMEIIAKGIKADRIDIWRLREKDDETYYTLEYEWSSQRVSGTLFAAGNKHDQMTVDNKVVPFMENLLSKGKTINSKVSDMPAAAKKLFQANGLDGARSALIMPIILSDRYWGFIGAFDAGEERIFTENEQLLLRSSRRMIASAMIRIETARDLVHKTEQLQYELNTKRDFFARMSHEIRTPLNAVLGMTELALREKMSNAAYEHIITVKQTGMNLLQIVNDILDFSKIESGNMDVISTDYALSSLVYDIVSIIRMRLAHTRIRFIVDIDSNLPGGLIGDEGKIRQILINLLTNAVKYTQKGFIMLTIKGKVRDDGMLDLILIVTDSGKGIKEEDQAKLFGDYVQVDQEKNLGIEGVGLGLSITRGLVAAMNGTISLKSKYGEGSEFTVVIPQKIENYEKLAKVSNPEQKTTLIYERRSLYAETLERTISNLGVRSETVDSAEKAIKEMATGSYAFIIGSTELLLEIKYDLEELDTKFQVIGITELSDEADSTWRALSTPIHTISLANIYNGEADRYTYVSADDASMRFSAPEAKVLVVDDIMTNLKVAAGLLAFFDVDIDICGNGAEAVELVKENRYDLIFMDHKMPGMDGTEATALIRAMGDNPPDGTSGTDAGAQAEYFKNVPIIVLTANVLTGMKEAFFEAGFSDFIAKPIDTVVLGNIMHKWIPKSKQRRYYSAETNENKPQFNAQAGISLTIQGVDAEKGFRTAGGRIETYLEILATFCDEAGERISQLYEYIETGNLRMYTITVHALKGALSNIGADEISAIAAKLEAAGDRKDMEYIEKNNERFASGINRLLVNIKSVLSETAKSAGDGKQADDKETDRFVTTLEELKTALVDMNAGVMNKAIETLLSDALTEQSLSTVRLISKHILMAEYDDAEQIISDLIDTLKDEQKG